MYKIRKIYEYISTKNERAISIQILRHQLSFFKNP